MQTVKIIIVILCITVSLSAQTNVLYNAHAHNDYNNENPLYDAIEHGFISIEVDVHLADGKLYAAHDAWEIDTTENKTIEALYLEPLKSIIADNGGFVYKSETPVILLVDFKTEAEKTYTKLKEILPGYASFLSSYEDGVVTERAVKVVISGKRPLETAEKENTRSAFIDGRMEDLKHEYPVSLIPLVSERASDFGGLNSDGSVPQSTINNVADFVNNVHAQNKLCRLWGVPDEEIYWEHQLIIGLDLIGTDDIEGLSRFLNTKMKLEDNNE